MSQHFQRQLDKLKQLVLALGEDVEQAVDHAIEAVETRNVPLAQQVIAGDEQIDLKEVDVEEECLHTLALFQPVAMDLRFMVALIKINGDLERIADLAVNIAEHAIRLAELPEGEIPFDLRGETVRIQHMVRRALASLLESDAEAAEAIFAEEEEVDRIHRQMYEQIGQAIREQPQEMERLIRLLNISRQLERIADHAVNIADDVVYMERGEMARRADKRQPFA